VLPFVCCLLQNAARNGKGKLTADVQMYAQTAVEVAQAKGVPYVDMYNSIMGVKDWDVSFLFLFPSFLAVGVLSGPLGRRGL
jgi:hypothetical protein